MIRIKSKNMVAAALAACTLIFSTQQTNAAVLIPTFDISRAGAQTLINGGETLDRHLNSSLSSVSIGDNLDIMKLAGLASDFGWKITTDEFLLYWEGTTNVPLAENDSIHIAGTYDISVPTSNSVSSSLHFYMADTTFAPTQANGHTENYSALSVFDPNTGVLNTSSSNADGKDTHTFTFDHMTHVIGDLNTQSWNDTTYWRVELYVNASLGNNDRVTVTIPNDSIDFTIGTLPGIPEPASLSLLTLASLALITRRKH
ncbi:PEP-CTERM sorting domain-containing protein [Planctomycetota bacterium]|nr:PEP-CTERM sorting domain-containing protein [Planctomycetota bacterium]